MDRLDHLACWSTGPVGPTGLSVQWTGWTNWPFGPMDRWTNSPVGPTDRRDEEDPRVERMREESDEEEAGNVEAEQEYGDEPAYGDEQEHGNGREHADEQEYGDEQTRAEPHIPSGAEGEERAPSAEHADSAAAAEEEEGGARAEETHATGSSRVGGHRARDVLRQEGQTREEEARTVQPRGVRRRSEAEYARMTVDQRRRAEPRDGSSRSPREPPPRTERHAGAEGMRGREEENAVRSAARPRPPEGGRGGEYRSPEPQRYGEGRRKEGSRSPRRQQQWGEGPSGASRSPDRRRWREGRREEAGHSPPGTRQQGKGREEWSPLPARRQLREAGPRGWERSHHSPARRWERAGREGSQWGQSRETRGEQQESRARSGSLAQGPSVHEWLEWAWNEPGKGGGVWETAGRGE
ncbi:unnamed protein product [Closterium sp. Naga37s-1]|nr:unnamed protein product [Closterium sp. Naga37s-1]